MHVQHDRVLVVLLCLAFGFGLVGVSAPAAAANKKAWASKKHKKTHHKSGKPKPASAGSPKSGGAAPAEEADDDEGEETAEDEQKADDTKAKPAKAKAASGDEDEARADNDEKGGGGDDDDSDSSVVHRKAKKPAMDEDGAAPVAFELVAGPSAMHRTFDFNDPLSDHSMAAVKPFAYKLPAGPVPFIDLALYPAAFATRGLAASFGIVGHYEKLIGTKTEGGTFTTNGQQFEVGLRGRLPVGEHEVGFTASYGKHTFHVSESDPPDVSATVPNVDYTFIGLGADARLRLSPIELRAHLGTRFVTDTGALGTNWYSQAKTTSINAGVSAAYDVTKLFAVVVGAEFLRYAFDFNPVPTNSPVIAGGAVDQYISGYLALRVTLSGG